MNKAVPWNIKGVDSDTREAAREAARRSGMSVGEWLNSVIADQAAAAGVDVEDMDDEERLEAVAARLSRRTPRLVRRDDRDEEAVSRRRPSIRARETRDEDDDAPRRSARGGSEDVLKSAFRVLERDSRRQGERTVEAISNVARRLEDIETRLSADRDRRVVARLPRDDEDDMPRRDDIRRRRDERPSSEFMNEARRAYERSDERPGDDDQRHVEERDRRPRDRAASGAEASLRDLERKIAAMNERVETKPKAEPKPEAETDLARIEIGRAHV